ncbi:uncharacterized protein LOC128302751 [Anopheles moucheti]|uniref:uncharacterized protein LOC128302751 n=1 Tax=Anopheles moucheti TaxID=186751 RepID=UPI0022F10F2B|nr:uncharacterized protein LOC128302751 [Anopheles moucheti]
MKLMLYYLAICNLGQLEKSYIRNKHSIHFQLFKNTTRTKLDKALMDAKKMGISSVVQLIDNQNENPRVRVRCGGFFVASYLEPPLSQLANVLLNGSLTKLDNFMYHVAVTPISTRFFVQNGNVVGFEVDICRLIIAQQKAYAQFHFTKTSEIGKVLQLLYYGQIDLFLNILQTKQHYSFVRAVWQQHRAYCITLPKKMERMHLELLLHPFEWQIWVVFISVLLLLQLINLIFPTKFNHNLIMICFFGSGPSEHVLPSTARLMVCAVCIIMFLLTETYQAILLSLIATDSHMKNPATVEEFLESNMTLYAIKGSMYMIPEKLLPVTHVVPTSMTIYSMFVHATVQPCSDALFWNTNPLKLNLPVREELISIQPPIFYSPHYVTFNHLSPLAHGYQTYMDRLFEVGIYHHLQSKWYPKKIFDEKEVTFNDSIVLADDLIPVWELLGFGLLFSSLIFVCEWSLFYIRFRWVR